MIVVSLFDGMACGYQALKEAGINVSEYHAFEIDEYAIKIAKKNHPEIIHHGSVVDADFTKFKNADLLIGGSPCQGFSFAGKQLAFNDERSKLLFEFIRAKKEIQPKNFLLENVRMKQEFLDIITKLIGVVPVLINSSLVSAQNRQRYYWCNWNIQQPYDKKILLKDIIEEINDQSYFVDRNKSLCIDANYHKGGNLEQYFNKNRRQIVSSKPVKLGFLNNKDSQANRIYSVDGKSVCLQGEAGGGGAKTGLYAIAQRGRNIVDGKRQDIKGTKTEQRFETSLNEKSNTITSIQKDSLLLELQKGNYKIRKLTTIECERLQTLPDNYTEGVSNTQRYKMLGNGWTVAVIKDLFNQLYSPLLYKLCQ